MSSRHSPTTPTARSCGSIGREHALEPINRQALADRERGRPRERRAVRRRHLQHQCLRPGDAGAPGRARDVRRAGRLGGRGGRRLVIGETFSWAQEALIALEVIKRGRVPAVDHARGAPGAGDARRLDAGGGLQAARGRRRRRRRAELHPRPAHDAAAAGARSVAAVECTIAALPVPYRTTTTSRPFSRCATRRRDCARRPAVPDGARPLHLQPLRGRRRSRARRSTLGIATLACAAAPARTTSAPWPRRWAAARRRAALGRHEQARRSYGSDPSLAEGTLRSRTGCERAGFASPSSAPAGSARGRRTGSSRARRRGHAVPGAVRAQARPRRLRGPLADHPARLPRERYTALTARLRGLGRASRRSPASRWSTHGMVNSRCPARPGAAILDDYDAAMRARHRPTSA